MSRLAEPHRRVGIDPQQRVQHLEAALRETESRLQDFLAVSSEWIWETDNALRFTNFWGRFEEATGFVPDALLGKTRQELILDHTDPAARQHLADLAARRPFRDFVYELVTPNGKRHLKISGKPIYGADGSFRGYRGTGGDITTEVEARRRADQTHRRFMDAIESIPASLMLCDADDRIVVSNSITKSYLREVPAHLLAPGTPFRDLIRAHAESGFVPEATGQIDAWVEERLRQHRGAEGMITRQYADGRWVQILERKTSDGGTIAIRVDITELKQHEQALARQTERLSEYANELEHSNIELEQFAYVASHDLQEPLRMVASYCQLLQRRYKGKLDANADEFIGFAVEGANRMQQLINDLLAYSRVGRRGQPFAAVNAADAVQAALSNLEAAIRESGATIEVDEMPVAAADLTQLTQLFQNLIGNAIKFRGDHPVRVRVTADRDGEMWRFVVEDNGIGIDPAYADRIFLIFQRLHERGKYSGTGIGLAICKKVVERHGGRIWVESAAGAGSRFYFTLRGIRAEGLVE
jgi:PAS domain S-box-containing protein